jgi:N-formylglutamate deformylase
MTFPFLVSVPHAGLRVPEEVEGLCILKEQDVIKDSDEGASEIYFPLRNETTAFVTTDIARAIVDMNRKEDDRGKDGVIKTHTCWDVPVYKEPLSDKVVTSLIERHYRPYHSKISRLSRGVRLGLDCHTMAEVGPPIGPDSGSRRPRVCLSNGDGSTCPQEWFISLSNCFSKAFGDDVSVNAPFKGGYITRSHAREIPWIQIELNREPFLDNEGKSQRVFQALKEWWEECTAS